jgi:hypothetical protein
MIEAIVRLALIIILAALVPFMSRADDARLTMFVGVDISGSFLNSRHFDDAMDFLAHYLYAHLKGARGTERPANLFVGSLGGNKAGEPKTFYPIESFENEDEAGIRKKLAEIFPKDRLNPFTDYNAFFEQVGNHVRNRKLVLKPISIVLISDGRPDLPGEKAREETFRKISFKPLELLSRNITVRLLYTDAVTGQRWQTKIPRKRVKVWTQDADVMETWHDEKIFLHGEPITKQVRFLAWMKSNVDFDVRSRRVD